MGIVANTVAAVGIAGTITLGAMTAWNGGASLTAAKNLIVQQADSLGIYHTHEGQLLNKISGLKSDVTSLNNQIDTLKNSGTADQTTIADLQAKVTADENSIKDLQTQLTTAQDNGNALAQRVDDLQAQVDQANKDAADLNTTTTANSTVSQSDDTAVANALDDPATPSTDPVTPTPDPTPTPSPAPTVPTMPADDTEVDYASVTQPHVLIYNGSTKEVQMNVVNGQVQLMNSSASADYDYSLDGGNTWTKTPYSFTNIGSTTTIDNTEIQIKNDTTGTITKFWMVNK